MLKRLFMKRKKVKTFNKNGIDVKDVAIHNIINSANETN